MPSLAMPAALACGMPTRLATEGECAAASNKRCCAGDQGILGEDIAPSFADLQTVVMKGFMGLHLHLLTAIGRLRIHVLTH